MRLVVLVAEPQLFDDMGVTGSAASRFGVVSAQTKLVIPAGGHPLTAGLSGTRTITASAEQFNWGVPGAAAAKGATLAGDSTQAASFGYESGAAMVGLSAPARRVGVFPSNSTATALTTDGRRLFDAAITWADG